MWHGYCINLAGRREKRRPYVEAATEEGTDDPQGHCPAVTDLTVTARQAAGIRPIGMTELGSIEGISVDPDTLLAACSGRAAETRREIAETVEALSGGGRGRLTDRQRAQIGNMLRRLVDEVEAAMLGGFVATLDQRDDLCLDAVADFAAALSGGSYDEIITGGKLLDPALIEAALHRMFEHALERELRPSIIDLWRAVSDTRSSRAPAAGGAFEQLSSESMRDYMVDRAARTDCYGDPVLRLDDLAPPLVARLHWRLAALLRVRAAAALDCRPSALDADIQRTVRTMLDAAERIHQPSAAMRAAEALAHERALDAGLVLDVLRRADVPLFFALFMRLTGLRAALARRLVFDVDGLGLAIAARAAGISADELAAIWRLTRHARMAAHLDASDNTDGLVATFNRIAVEDAVQVCDYWRLEPDYLDAVWSLRSQSTEQVTKWRF